MKQQRHVGKDRAARPKRFPRRWLLLVALGIAFVVRLRRQRDTLRAPAVSGRAPGAPVADAPAPAEQAGAQRSGPVEPEDAAEAVPDQPEELSPTEMGRVLGCSPSEAARLVDGASCTRESVEQLALEHYRWRRHVDDPGSYWVTLKQASAILGISTQQLKRLLDSGAVPYVVHRDGVRLMRREQLDAAADAAHENVI